MENELMTVDGPFGGRTYEISELAGSDYETVTIINHEQAEALLTALAAKLGYTLTKES
jgi:hypothetical protein